MAAQCDPTTTLSLPEQFARLPIELLMEVASYMDKPVEHDSIPDEPRSRHTSAYLLALMAVNPTLRRIARPVFWSEVHITSKVRVGRPTPIALLD
jgi:hypothetical protein